MWTTQQEQAILHPKVIDPDIIGPNTRARAQLTNFLSLRKSQQWIKRNHVRSRSNETRISLGRRNIGKWAMFEENLVDSDEDCSQNEEDFGDGEFLPSTILPENFIDHIAHKTKSCTLLNGTPKDIQFEKLRFRMDFHCQSKSLDDLKRKEFLLGKLLSLEKSNQAMNAQIKFLTERMDPLEKQIELKTKQRDCMELIIGELIFQIESYKARLAEAEKIAIQMAQNASKKVRMKGSVRGSTFAMMGSRYLDHGSSMGLARARGSRANGLNTKGSQMLARGSQAFLARAASTIQSNDFASKISITFAS